MPKTKKLEDSDSDSDSGPDDRRPIKKSKSSDDSSSSKRHTNDEGNSYWDLDHQKRITVREFRGKLLIDIREFYEKDGKMLPGKKGISLSASHWNTLKSLIDDVDGAIKANR